MPTVIKPKRGLEATRSGTTPESGELAITTDERKIYLGDGATAGGNPINYVDNFSAESIGGNKTFTGNIIISGDITVNGTATTVNTNSVTVSDNIMVLNNDETGTPSQNGGIEIERGTETNATMIWDEAADRWVAGLAGSEATVILSGDSPTFVDVTATGNISVTGTVDGRDVNADGVAQDNHIADASKHFVINDLSTAADEALSAQEIDSRITSSNDAMNSIEEMTDSTITSLTDGEVLLSSSGSWVNQTLSEANIAAKDDVDAMFTKSGNDITFKGNLLPDTDDTWNIGSATKKLQSLYVGAQTIYLGDQVTLEGTGISIDAGASPTALGEQPTVLASKIVAKPFTYNPGGGNVNVRPSIEFQDGVGNSYPISFDTSNLKFSFDTPSGVGLATLVGKRLEVSNAGADAIDVEGNVMIDSDLRADGNVNLGYDQNNTVTIKGTAQFDEAATFDGNTTFTAPIELQGQATIGDGNDTVTVNAGGSHNFVVSAMNIDVTSGGAVTAQGDLTATNIITAGNVDGRDVSVDGAKLDLIEDNANAYVHPTIAGNKHIPAGGSSGQSLVWSADGTAVWSSSGGSNPFNQSLETTDSPTFNNLTLDGDLTVSGTTTTVNSNEVNIGDSIILLNSDEIGSPTEDGGVEIERGSSTNARMAWNETSDSWEAGIVGNMTAIVLTDDSRLSDSRTCDGTFDDAGVARTALNVEDGAAADQTGSEIKSLYEAELDTNAFTDAEKSKLGLIEASATADQTGAEIKTAYEAENDTNAFTDAEKSKLSGIAASANNYIHPATHSADILTNGTTNKVFTAAEQSKLSGIEASANNYSHPTGNGNQHLPADGGAGQILGWSSAGTAQWIDGDNPFDQDLNTTDSPTFGGAEIEGNLILNTTNADGNVLDLSGGGAVSYIKAGDAANWMTLYSGHNMNLEVGATLNVNTTNMTLNNSIRYLSASNPTDWTSTPTLTEVYSGSGFKINGRGKDTDQFRVNRAIASATQNLIRFSEVDVDRFVIDKDGNAIFSNDVVVSGDLTVSGTTTSVNSNEVNIGDSQIVLNSDETGVPTQDGGIEIERGTSTNALMIFNETFDKWQFGLSGAMKDIADDADVVTAQSDATQALADAATAQSAANAAAVSSVAMAIALG